MIIVKGKEQQIMRRVLKIDSISSTQEKNPRHFCYYFQRHSFITEHSLIFASATKKSIEISQMF